MSQMRNPVDFERALLTKMCVDRDTIGDVLKNALTVRHFHDPENGQVFEYVVSSYRRYGKPPGKDLVLAYFPGFRWIDNEALPGALIEELQQRQFHTEILAVTEDMRRSLADGKGLKPSEVFDALRQKVQEIGLLSSRSDAVSYFPDAIDSVMAEYEKARSSKGLTGIELPWESLNLATMGLHPQEMVVVSARPKCGKTWWMEYVASFVANSGHRVLFKTIEMSVRAINQRMAAILSGLQYARLREGSLTSQDEDKLLSSLVLAAANQFPLTVIGREPGDAELATLRGHCERIKPEVLFIDGVYLLTARDHEQQATLSDSIKRLSQELDIPVIVSTQLNRDAGDEKETKLSDLAFSDSYGQNADLVIALRRGQEEKALDRLRHDLPGQRESKVECYYTNWVLCSDFSECKVDSEIATISDGGEETKETPGVSE